MLGMVLLPIIAIALPIMIFTMFYVVIKTITMK